MAKLILAEQRSPEWFAARLGRATGSRFNDIICRTRSGYAASRKNYRAELIVERLTGTKDDSYTSSAMQWGIDNEPVARLQYMLNTGKDVEDTGFWIHDELMAGASPDGFVGTDGLLEIKCPNTATHIDTLTYKKLPKQYLAQVQGQMWITERKWCDFVTFDPRMPENAQMLVIRVDRDDDYIKELEIEVTNFLEEVDQLLEFVKDYGKVGA